MAYIGNTVQNQGFTPAIDYFNGNGVTVTFTLSRPIASVAQLIVAIDNVIQNPSSSFTVAGNAITFSSAPLSGSNNIWVEYTSLITTYQGISQDPTVIGDIRATGGYLAEGDFGNSFVDGAILDYVTGLGRITVGDADGLAIYNGGTTARSSLLALTANGALGVGTSPSYGTTGQVLQSTGSSTPPVWATVSVPYNVEYLVVAGGGSGGGRNVGGGGGAGGYISTNGIVAAGTAYTVTVGAGGTGVGGSNGQVGNSGSASSFNNSTAVGGGGGGYGVPPDNGGSALNGLSGGSGGGGGGVDTGTGGSGGSGTAGQGNAGALGTTSAVGGGGGGAGAAGSVGSSGTGGNGGAGLNWQSLGTFYAGGGGGGGNSGSGAGGAGGGGTGGRGNPAGNQTSGTANTGGGGGGNGGFGTGNTSGSGGSGIVIIRYLGSQKGSGGTVTSAGGYTYHTFTSSGTYTA